MQQSSATQSLHLSFSCNSFWHGVIPTSYFIFILVLYVCRVFCVSETGADHSGVSEEEGDAT